MTQAYYDFCIRRAKFNGKVELLNQLNELTDNGMPLSGAIGYIGKELQKESNILILLEKHYEGDQ